MTSMLKQRLVGAVVLIALGVIFIPMLLTGEGNFLSGEMESNVPPKPMYELKAPKVTPLEIPADKASAKSGEPVMEPIPAQATNVDTNVGNKSDNAAAAEISANPDPNKADNREENPPQASVQDSKAKDNDVATKEAAVKETAVKEKQATTQSSESKTQVQEPVVETKSTAKTVSKPKPAKKPIVSGWAVQLGSFSVQKNALKLRDRLRKKGHASFVEEYARAGKTHYRVRVGPELTRELATELKKKLKAETKIDGFIVSFPDK